MTSKTRYLNIANNEETAKQIVDGFATGRVERIGDDILFRANVEGTESDMKMIWMPEIYKANFKEPYNKWSKEQDFIKLFDEVEIGEQNILPGIKQKLTVALEGCNVVIFWKQKDEYNGHHQDIAKECHEIRGGIRCFELWDNVLEITLQNEIGVNGLPDMTSFAMKKRQEFDFRVGAAFTRWQTFAIRDLYTDKENAIREEYRGNILNRIFGEHVKGPQPVEYGAVMFTILGIVVRHQQQGTGNLTVEDLLEHEELSSLGTGQYLMLHIRKLVWKRYIRNYEEQVIPTPLGKALILGYASAGAQDLTKSDLRKRFEENIYDRQNTDEDIEMIYKKEIETYKSLFTKLRQNVELFNEKIMESFQQLWP